MAMIFMISAGLATISCNMLLMVLALSFCLNADSSMRYVQSSFALFLRVIILCCLQRYLVSHLLPQIRTGYGMIHIDPISELHGSGVVANRITTSI